jgi:hypothetical protein
LSVMRKRQRLPEYTSILALCELPRPTAIVMS